MKDFVSHHRFSVAASISMLLLGWAVFVSPGGSWPGMLSVAALAVLLTSAAVVLIGRLREPAPSMAQVIHDVDTQPADMPSADWKGKAILKLKVRPLHDRLVVRRVEEKETAKGGIIIPDTAKEKPQEGEVLAVGNGKVLDNGTKVALDVKVGDKILFGKYSGTDIKIDGEDVLILREDEVLAVLA